MHLERSKKTLQTYFNTYNLIDTKKAKKKKKYKDDISHVDRSVQYKHPFQI